MERDACVDGMAVLGDGGEGAAAPMTAKEEYNRAMRANCATHSVIRQLLVSRRGG